MEPEELQEEGQSSPPGRVRAAWRVLRGHSVVPEQIRQEWFEYQQIFNDLLTRLSAQLARQAKAEKKRIAAVIETAENQPELDLMRPSSSKADLRRRAAILRGVPGARQLPTGTK